MLRGSVHPFLEAEDMPVDFFPGDVLPGHHQGGALHRVSRQCRPVIGFGCRCLILCLLAPARQPLGAGLKIIYHPQSGWFEDTPLKGGTEAGYPLKGVEEGTSLLGLRSVGGTTTALR